MNITTIGLDIAKNVFAVCGLNTHGKPVLKKTLKRAQVLTYFANLPACLIGIEACPGAHYWARELFNLGHTVKLLPAQHVKRYLTGDKTDARDAMAIAEALTRPTMTFVAVNTEAQQDLQMLHRVRERLVKQRRALLLQIRGLLNEYGIVFATGTSHYEAMLQTQIADEQRFSGLARTLWQELLNQLQDVEMRIAACDTHLNNVCRDNEDVKRLRAIPGIGPVIATALVASVGNAQQFRNGRKLAACLGLVPTEYSSGGKQKQYGISKRGNKYLRTQLIHGARSALRWASKRTDRLSQWALAIQAKHGFNVASVALANKLARIAWVILAKHTHYQERHVMVV